MKSSNSCCLTVVGIFSLIAIGIMLLLARCTYTSPVNEAGREYQKNIKVYQNIDIETMDDVYNRLEVLDNHFSSPTFDKMQGGEREEVQLSDIETLFGSPDNIIENVEIKFIDTVYQYDYENQTINFHESFNGIDEYVIEDYHSIRYTSESLDQLLFNVILNHQTKTKQIDDEFESITLDTAPETILNKLPTRELKQNGWHTWSYSPIQYFDDGSGEYAPDEYLSLQYKEENGEFILRIMERRYKEAYLHLDNSEEAERKLETYFDFKERIDEKETNELDERITIRDLSNAFGDISKFQYTFRNGLLRIAWLSNHEINRAFFTDIPIQNISTVEDLNNLDVDNLDMSTIHLSDERHSTNKFIGSK